MRRSDAAVLERVEITKVNDRLAQRKTAESRRCVIWSPELLLWPEFFRREMRAFDERFKFGPRDLRVDAAT
jgi:hypothetical protein